MIIYAAFRLATAATPRIFKTLAATGLSFSLPHHPRSADRHMAYVWHWWMLYNPVYHLRFYPMLCLLSLSVCLCFCFCLSVCLSVCLSLSLCISVSLYLCLSVGRSVGLSVCLSVSVSICLSVCLSLPLSLFYIMKGTFAVGTPPPDRAVMGYAIKATLMVITAFIYRNIPYRSRAVSPLRKTCEKLEC